MENSSTSYTLYLTTYPIAENVEVSPIDASNFADVKWNINWDALFRNQQDKYNRCRLRIRYISQFRSTSTAWNPHLGYLTCNLPSNNCGGTMETLLGLLYFQFLTRYGTSSRNPTETQQYDFSTMNEPGVDIIIPRGQTMLNIKMYSNESFTTLTNMGQNYQMILHFELYNELPPKK